MARAVTYHKTDVTTQEARIRSQGLTHQQKRDRDARDAARKDYYTALRLRHTYKWTWWTYIPYDHKAMLEELWNGNLYAAMRSAEAKIPKVEAKRFLMDFD